MNERPLSGRTAIITGAGRGLGKSMAVGLASRGAQVALLDIEEDILLPAKREVEAAGGQGCALSLTCDVTEVENVNVAVKKTIENFGGIDILINDAAMGPQYFTKDFTKNTPKFWEMNLELWQRVLTVNSFGPHLMAGAIAPYLIKRGWGRIINVTTSLDTMYLRGCGAYGPSKAALEANTRIMAQDLEGTGVTANILIPGGPANTRMIPEETGFDRTELVQPEDMQAPICWLCSSEADKINNKRFIAARWDETTPIQERIAKAGAPTAWEQVGSLSQRPSGWKDD